MTHRLPLALFALGLPLVAIACGGGGDLGAAPPGPTVSSPSAPFVPAPAPALWADDGCAVCHGADGSGAGGGPNIQCTTYARLDSHVRTAGTSHVGGAFPLLSDDELLQIEAFLRTADCPGTSPGDPTPPTGDVPSTHTKNEDGVLHHPDYERNLATCTTCHGANLEGTSFAPSCASCHGSDGFEDDAFEDEASDDGLEDDGEEFESDESEAENEVESEED